MTDWHLDITSYRGITWVASHYYGCVRDDDFDGPRHDVLRVLDEAGAKELSRYDDFPWKAGDDTGRFDSRDELIAAALVIFNEVAAPGETLWNRSSIYVERDVLSVRKGDS